MKSQIIRREPIQVLAQKTVVASPEDSRNSIRPLLEQAGYRMDYERYSRTLTLRDGVNREIMRIMGVKGIQDFTRFATQGELFPYMIAGLDIVLEAGLKNIRVDAINRQNENGSLVRFNSLINLKLGECTLEYLVPPEFKDIDVSEMDSVFTKYPNLFRAKCDEVMSGKGEFQGEVEYSDSPDTTLATASEIQRIQKKYYDTAMEKVELGLREKDDVSQKKAWNRIRKWILGKGKDDFIPKGFPEISMGAFEIVETGKSAEKLGLVRGSRPEFTIPIYTGIFQKQSPFSGVEDPVFEEFANRIREVLQKQ